MLQNQEEFDKKIGYLWIILGSLFLANILLFGAISDWYTLPIKNSPRFDTYLIVVTSIITQGIILVSALYIGFLMVIFY